MVVVLDDSREMRASSVRERGTQRENTRKTEINEWWMMIKNPPRMDHERPIRGYERNIEMMKRVNFKPVLGSSIGSKSPSFQPSPVVPQLELELLVVALLIMLVIFFRASILLGLLVAWWFGRLLLVLLLLLDRAEEAADVEAALLELVAGDAFAVDG